MAAGTRNITIEQGATFRETATVTATGTSVALNLTGWTGRAKLRNVHKDESSSTVIETLSVTVTDAANGVLQYELSATQTAAINTVNNPSGVWDLEIESDGTDPAYPNGFVFRVVQGTWNITGEATA